METPNKFNLDELRLLYGEVKQIQYKDHRQKLHTIIVRKPKFDEYLFFNKYANVEGEEGEEQRYELDPEVTDLYFNRVVVYPENINISEIPAGIIVKACEASVLLSDFENGDRIRDLYIKSIRSANSQAGAIMIKIISAFGIDGYLAAKHLSEEEIIDILVSIETITNTPGEFALLTNMQGLPINPKNRRLDVHALLGIKKTETNKKNPIDDHNRKKLKKYYESLRIYTPEQIDEIINRLEGAESVYSHNRNTENNDGKIDINDMSDSELGAMSKSQYQQMQKEGKILSPEESRKHTLEQNKNALSDKIAADRQEFGETKPPPVIGAEHFKGDLSTLLSDINSKIRNIE